jgi:hypothetical protein
MRIVGEHATAKSPRESALAFSNSQGLTSHLVTRGARPLGDVNPWDEASNPQANQATGKATGTTRPKKGCAARWAKKISTTKIGWVYKLAMQVRWVYFQAVTAICNGQ